MTKPGHANAVLRKAGRVSGALALEKVLAGTVRRNNTSRAKKLVRRSARAATVLVAVMTVQAVRRKVSSADPNTAAASANRVLAVTVNCTPEELDSLPQPLAALQDQIEVIVHEAPGGRGTEVAARLVEPPRRGIGGVLARVAGTDPRQDVRLALRQAKSLIETGEVLRAQTPPTTHSTLLGKPLDLAIRRSHGEGRL
jgi:hypothetical protein